MNNCNYPESSVNSDIDQIKKELSEFKILIKKLEESIKFINENIYSLKFYSNNQNI